MSVAAKVINLDEPSTVGDFHETAGSLILEQPSRVFLDVRPDDINSFIREGTDLIVDIGGEKLRIINFYHVDGDSRLYLQDNDCSGFLLAELSPAADDGTVFAQYIPQAETSPFDSLTCAAAGGGAGEGYGWAAAAIAVIGGGIGLGVALGDDGDDPDPIAPHAPDRTPPAEPTIDSVIDDVAPITGTLASGDSTNDTTPTLTGTAEANSTITVFQDGALIGTTTTDGSGNWSFTPNTALVDGNTYAFTVTATDAAGNKSTPSTAFTLTIDTTAPVVSFDGLTTNDTTPALTGTVDDPTATVVVTVGGIDYTATNNGDGTWTLADNTLPVQPEGTASITVTATDTAGNSGTATGSVTADTTPPVLLSAATSADGTSLMLTYDEALDAANPPAPGNFVVNVNGAPVTVSNVTVSGDTVTLSLASPVANGDIVTASYTDPTAGDDANATQDLAGNDAASFTDTAVTNNVPDTTAPTTSVSIDSISVDSGLVGDFITNDNDGLTVGATLSAALAADEVLMYSHDNGSTWTDISSAVTGTAVSYADAGLTSSATILMQVEDTAGNAGPQASQAIVIDTTAPAITSTVASASEEGLSGGDPDTVGTPADTTNLATVSGTMTITDADSSVAEVSVSAPVGVTSGGQTVSWSGSFAAGTYTLNGTIDAGATPVATLTLSTIGAYTFTLEQPLDHPLEGIEDILGLDFSVAATDEAGNVSSPASLMINVEDDMPVAAAPALFEILAPVLPADPETGTLVESFGADGGYVSQVTIDGYTFAYDPDANSVTGSGNSELVVSHNFNAGNDELTIETVKGETLVVNMVNGSYSYTNTGVPLLAPEVQVAPEVGINESSGLLGIAGANVLGLIDLSLQQFFTATDDNQDIDTVVIQYAGLLGLGPLDFDASDEIAAELGLTFNVVTTGILGLLAPTSTLTITALDGGPIDNLRLNELLGTVTLDGELLGLIDGDLLSSFTISATDTEGHTTVANLNQLLDLGLLPGLLGSTQPSAIQEGTAGNDSGAGALVGGTGNDRLYGYAGNDELSGNEGNDLLRGGAGTDSLDGGDGNDILIGGAGNDTLSGGSGNDVFLWEKGDAGTAGSPATDTIVDFNAQPLAGGGDIIDLGSLLQGEGRIGNNPGNLTNYLHFEVAGADTVLSISTTGQFQGGYAAGAVDQQITFTGVDLVGSFTTDQEVIANLLNRGNLIVDEATVDTDLLAGTTTINAVITDNDGDTAGTSVNFDSTGMTVPGPNPNNVAPVVQVNSGALLGLISAGALNIINLDTQDLTATDADGNLRSVVVAYQPLLSVDLTALQLTASSQLAVELGLEINVVNDPGLLGLVAPSSVLTITAVGGGDINNLDVNELLATVQFDDAFDLLGLDVRLAVLDATTITATDSAGLVASESLANLLAVDALNTLEGNADIIEGTTGNDILDSSVLGGENERLYGHDGNDTLNAGAGDDLLRGGSGDDVLNGGDGNDLLIDGNGSDTFNAGAGDDLIIISGDGFASIDGGDGFDILTMDAGIDLDLDGIDDHISDIEGIDMAYDDEANSLTLTEEAVTSLTDADNQLYILGESNDTLNVVGATATGATTSLNGAVLDVYSFGSNTLFVDEDVQVVVV